MIVGIGCRTDAPDQPVGPAERNRNRQTGFHQSTKLVFFTAIRKLFSKQTTLAFLPNSVKLVFITHSREKL